MQFLINNSINRPAYQQIVDQVKRDVALGRTKDGQKLPTIRQLAAQLVINPNTIAKAYRQLEQESIIVTKVGSGAFISSADSGLNKSVRKKLICEDMERVIVEAFHMQIDKKSLRDWFGDSVEKFNLSATKGR